MENVSASDERRTVGDTRKQRKHAWRTCFSLESFLVGGFPWGLEDEYFFDGFYGSGQWHGGWLGVGFVLLSYRFILGSNQGI